MSLLEAIWMAKQRRPRAPNDGGSIDQRPSGRWRLRVRPDGWQVTYGLYETEGEALQAQARWRLTHLLSCDDPDLNVEVPASVAVGEGALRRLVREMATSQGRAALDSEGRPRARRGGVDCRSRSGPVGRVVVARDRRPASPHDHPSRNRRRLALDGGGWPSAEHPAHP